MDKLVKKELRVNAEKLKNIRELMANNNINNEAAFLRELIDIGYYVKKKQLESKGGAEEDELNWESVYQDASIKMIECHHLIKQIFSSTFNTKQSKYDGYGAEIISNKLDSDNRIDQLLSGAGHADTSKKQESISEDHEIL